MGQAIHLEATCQNHCICLSKVTESLMRITYVNPVGVVGGAEKVLLTILRTGFQQIPNYAPSLLLFADGPLRTEAEKLGVAVSVVPLPAEFMALGDSQFLGVGKLQRLLNVASSTFLGIPNLIRFRQNLLQSLLLTSPEIVYSNGLKAHILTALARPKNIPLVWHLHDFFSPRPLMAKLLRVCQGSVNAAVAISRAVSQDVSKILPKLPIQTILNAVDTDHFSPGVMDNHWLDEAAGLPAFSGIRIGLVATYANWKGQDVFLHALAKIPATYNFRGYIIGGPIYSTAGSQFARSDLEASVKSLGLADRVGFLPFQSDPRDVYRSLDVVVHASTRPEPFGLTIAEAMSCGKPVVVAAAGGALELFTDQVDGVGHIPGDAQSLADAIMKFAGNSEMRVNIGAAARIHAVKDFGLERYGREMADFYRTLVK
jgi:glycosyltransferase involved in cell wall biosynthesis